MQKLILCFVIAGCSGDTVYVEQRCEPSSDECPPGAMCINGWCVLPPTDINITIEVTPQTDKVEGKAEGESEAESESESEAEDACETDEDCSEGWFCATGVLIPWCFPDVGPCETEWQSMCTETYSPFGYLQCLRTSSGELHYTQIICDGLSAEKPIYTICAPTIIPDRVSCQPDADRDGTSDASDCDDTDPEIRENCTATEGESESEEPECTTDANCQSPCYAGICIAGVCNWIMRDDDGDGEPACDAYGTFEARDCDDGNATVYRGAIELCDGLDNDCNGAVDEIFTERGSGCYRGEGDCQREGVMACQPDGSNQCVDEDGAVIPEPTEICSDDLDNDCDGNTDCGTSDCGPCSP